TGAAAGYYGVVKPGDATLGPVSSLTASDRFIMGSPTPTWFGGFTNTLSYKGIGLEIFVRFSGGNKVFNASRSAMLASQGFINNGKEILNRWTPTNTNTDVPKLYYGRDNVINLDGQLNSRYLENGDYLRLQNIMLFYVVKKSSLD